MSLWRSFWDDDRRREILARLRSLDETAAPRWGKMSAPRMVAHLTDQMRHALGEAEAGPRRGPLAWAPVRYASIYLVPWPKGRVQGPPDAFVSQPGDWPRDVEQLATLVERFAEAREQVAWPRHALFGPMSRRDWGVFCHKHFDHHLRQFGV